MDLVIGTVAYGARPAPLDYYLILSSSEGRGSPEGILVEEFVRNDDCTTAGLRTAGWTAAQGRWWSAVAFSRSVREDPSLAARIVPALRGDAERVYTQHGTGPLPAEALLRHNFHEYATFPASSVLRLRPADVPAGFAESRHYRVLFAKDLGPAELAKLQTLWRSTVAGPFESDARVMASARVQTDQEVFTWDLRRVGPRLAWCLDVSVLIRSNTETAIGRVLDELISAVRQQGLIPVTIERFS